VTGRTDTDPGSLLATKPQLRIKRIYDEAARGDGHRILTDRIWPRGVSRARARLDDWSPELGPSDELRKWFNHVPARYAEFRARYRSELWSQSARLEELRRRATARPVTILYAARDQKHNNAVVLAELLRDGWS